MRPFQQVLVCSALIVLGTASARATVIWRGDYQTGNLKQWDSVESANPSHLQIVQSPVPPGDTYALSVTVVPGDVIYGGTRDEVDYTSDSPKPGDERYYHWQTMWPSDYQSPNTWQLFTQWHQYSNGGSPPLQFYAEGEQIMLADTNDHRYWTAPLVRGVWHDFIVHVVWSSDSSVGGVEIWYDGAHVLPFTNGATMFPNDTIYLKQGLYRNSSVNFNQTIYHAGMTVATTLADVASSAVGAPDAGIPVGGADAGSSTTGGGTSPSDGGTSSGSTHHHADGGVSASGGQSSDAGQADVDAGAVQGSTGSDQDGGSTMVTSGSPSGRGSSSETAGAGPVTANARGCDAAGDATALTLVVLVAFLIRRKRTT